MASSITSKLLSGKILAMVAKPCSSRSFCTKFDLGSDSEPESEPISKPTTPRTQPLQDGLDPGVFKAILVGQVGQPPIQKKLRSGRTITLVSLATGGIRNNRRPLDHEDPKEYANRCAIQWHRVSIYPERLGDVAVKSLVPGSVLYVEGNLETKVFNDPITGLVRRIREVAVRRNGRIVMVGSNSEDAVEMPRRDNTANVGYY